MCECLRPFPLLNAPVRNWQLGEERRGGEGTARDGIIIGPLNEGSEAGEGKRMKVQWAACCLLALLPGIFVEVALR